MDYIGEEGRGRRGLDEVVGGPHTEREREKVREREREKVYVCEREREIDFPCFKSYRG